MYSPRLLRQLPIQQLWRQRSLIVQLTMFGLLWSFINPLLMLAVYTFVFSTIFKVRWGSTPAGKLDFALMVFAGMLLFIMFGEVLSRAPRLIQDNANYVKRVIFPLDILPLTAVGAAFFHSLVGLAVLTLFVAANQGLSLSILALPLVLLPYLLMLTGLAWLFSAIGVYFRDLAQTVSLIVAVLQFVSPVFYPVEAVPEAWRSWLSISPLTLPIEQLRTILLTGAWPEWISLCGYSLISLACALGGLAVFSLLRRGFADVL
jgi:lipopolysaccharide transport system permease protein